MKKTLVSLIAAGTFMLSAAFGNPGDGGRTYRQGDSAPATKIGYEQAHKNLHTPYKGEPNAQKQGFNPETQTNGEQAKSDTLYIGTTTHYEEGIEIFLHNPSDTFKGPQVIAKADAGSLVMPIDSIWVDGSQKSAAYFFGNGQFQIYSTRHIGKGRPIYYFTAKIEPETDLTNLFGKGKGTIESSKSRDDHTLVGTGRFFTPMNNEIAIAVVADTLNHNYTIMFGEKDENTGAHRIEGTNRYHIGTTDNAFEKFASTFSVDKMGFAFRPDINIPLNQGQLRYVQAQPGHVDFKIQRKKR